MGRGVIEVEEGEVSVGDKAVAVENEGASGGDRREGRGGAGITELNIEGRGE
jgi:hypothetical protein